jgi:hypothetical protein
MRKPKGESEKKVDIDGYNGVFFVFSVLVWALFCVVG